MKKQPTIKRSTLAILLAACLAQGAVHAQSTTGSIYGTVPAGQGTSIVVQNDSGLSRTISVEASGRYSLGNLPVGTYTVILQRDGQTVDTRRGVTLRVGAGTDVSFGSGDTRTLDTVEVVAANVPKVDVTTTDTRTVVTAEQLRRLPLAQNAEAIAMLAPGAVEGNDYQFGLGNHGGAIAFGGASVAENAYYINGYFSGTPTTNVGGYSLPYGSIAQQETYTGGYSAKYGRSVGGIISQVGKSGSDEVHFGGQITWSPKRMRASSPDRYYPNESFPVVAGHQYQYINPALAGALYSRGDENFKWGSTYSGYVSGPLIKDRLYGFVAGEVDIGNDVKAPTAAGGGKLLVQRSRDPKLYAKLNWNISDDHLLEYTYMGRGYHDQGDYYRYDFPTATRGAYLAPYGKTRENDEFSITKYTGFLTDTLTVNATYGRQRLSYLEQGGIPAMELPYISGGTYQNPAYWPAGTPTSGITNAQSTVSETDARDYTTGLRAELEWVIGDHTLVGGIDNMKFTARNEGSTQKGDYWIYGKSNPALPINEDLDVGAPGGEGYWVDHYTYSTATSMSLKQQAYYLEDRWQVSDDIMLSLGLRNDKFTNYNVAGKPYVASGDQWAPRLGASWDVFGDSTLKVFANAGRYFLAMPNEVAVRGAAAAYHTDEYFTYTGIAADGSPTGLTRVPTVGGNPAGPGEVSANHEFGQAKDPATVAASNLKSQFQDEYILGFEKTLGNSWLYGGKLTYRDLKSAIDDICDADAMLDKIAALGDSAKVDADAVYGIGCWLGNPNATNTFKLANADHTGYYTLSMSPSDWGWPSRLKRTYTAVDLFLEHPFDGKWEGRIDYTWSKNKGNTEGPANTDTGQGGSEHDSGVSLSQNWDIAAIMMHADGYLPNDRRHQIKARGSYAISPEWTVSGNLRIMSGSPINCFDYYGEGGAPLSDPLGYRGSYHTCFGEASAPGKKYLPWTRQLDLGVTYRPVAFGDMLAVSVNVFNVFNQRETTYIQSKVPGSRGAPYTVVNTYNMPLSFQTPRYVMFSVSMDY